jgi:hypothetical protein
MTRRLARKMVPVLVLLTFGLTTTASRAANSKALCVVLLDLSSSSGQPGAASPNGGKVTQNFDFRRGRLDDVKAIIKSCGKRKATLEFWAIDGNPEAQRKPLIAEDLAVPKGLGVSQDEFVTELIGPISCAVQVYLGDENSCKKIPTPKIEKGTDVVGAIRRAGNRLADYKSGRRSLYILSDGFQNCCGLYFETGGSFENAERQKILKELVTQKLVPDLRNVDGCFRGAGVPETVSDGNNPRFLANIKMFWKEFLLAAGATKIQLTDDSCFG